MTDVMADVESRMGIESLDGLLAKRAALVKEAADLRARHGPGGSYEALRKIEWTRIATLIRTKAIADNVKKTEAAIEQEAHTDPAYIGFVTTATLEKAQWAIVEDKLQAISDRILRANAIARYLSAEVSLSR